MDDVKLYLSNFDPQQKRSLCFKKEVGLEQIKRVPLIGYQQQNQQKKNKSQMKILRKGKEKFFERPFCCLHTFNDSIFNFTST